MAGGIAFTGSGSFSDALVNTSNEYAHLTISLTPTVTFYLIDFFAFSIAPSFSYASNYTSSTNYEPTLNYGVSFGFTWYPYFDPGHLIRRNPSGGLWVDVNSWKWNPNYPLVLAFGFSAGPFVEQWLSGMYSDGDAYGEAMQFIVRLTPSFAVYYFISERYALDIALNPTVAIPVDIYSSPNSPTNYTPTNGVQFTYSVSFGITFFVPWAERSLIRR
jgi:hypothetical protein